ncbi:hypothetical protein D9M68_754810 [compost metagenome]
MTVLVRLGNLRIMWVGAAALHNLGGDRGLVRRGPTFHQAQSAHGGLGDHPVMDTGIGLLRP